MALLEVEGLTKAFGGLTAINQVEFSTTEGEILGLIGPNGAGKTTLFNLMTGCLKPDQGTIQFRAEEIQGLTPHEISRKGIGRTFQIAKSFSHMSTLDNVMVGGFIHDRDIRNVKAAALEILEFTGLTAQRDALAENLIIGDLRRLEIAKAMATKPTLLLLDEVMAGLNPTETEEAIDIIRKIRDRGVTILIVEHVMHAIMSLSDRVIVVHHGEKIAEGIPEEVTKNAEVIEAYLGEDYLIS
jgi:branched-chain amino acid transport system ATP-binding protein